MEKWAKSLNQRKEIAKGGVYSKAGTSQAQDEVLSTDITSSKFILTNSSYKVSEYLSVMLYGRKMKGNGLVAGLN